MSFGSSSQPNQEEEEEEGFVKDGATFLLT